MLFDTFVTTVWKPSCAKLRECTKVGYESTLNCHILPQWSGRNMDAISVADIESWLDSFDKPGAARKAYAVFRAILRLAFKRGLTDNDVTRREIRLPHLRHYDPQVLSAPEVRRLLKGFYGHALEAWLLVSVCAGLRRCESVGLEWADLDLRRGTVTVKRSVQWVAGHETVTEPKTDLSRRTVALPRFAVKRLAELRRRSAMRIQTARQTVPSGRSQCDGVRLQRADGENAHRQSERNHPMREHGSRWQQSALRRLALLSAPMRIVFRNPAVWEKQWQRRNLSNRENTQSECD